MQRGIHVLIGGTSARFQETLFEVVTQKSVKYGVHCGVRVRETTGDQVDGDDELGGLFFGSELGDLGDPIREPTTNVNGYNSQDEISDFSVGLFLFFGFVFWTDRFQFLYDQTIKHQNQTQRYEETADESVQRKRCRFIKLHLKRSHIIADVNASVIFIPNNRARVIPVFRAIFNLSCVRNQRNHQQNTERPRQNGHDPRNGRRSPFRRRNRMTHRYIPISAHNKQKNRTRELIDTRQNQIRLTHNRPENPRLFNHRHYQKWYPN